MDQLSNAWNTFIGFLPSLIGGIVLILVAWIVASLVRRGVRAGLNAANLDERLSGGDDARTSEPDSSMEKVIAQVFYYLVWVLFLPSIFDLFGLTAVSMPIQNMLNTALAYLPNILGAIALVVIAVVVGRFIKNLVYNLALSLNIDRWISKFTGGTDDVDEADASVSESDKNTIANVLANIVYVLFLIPILIVALETLGIQSISEPIVNVLNTILAAIPNVLVAVILLGVGIAVAKLVGDLTTNLLQGTGINNLTDNLGDERARNFDLAQISGQVVAGLIGLFFFVEALNALNLQVLNTIGAAIISYLPNVIFAVIILGVAIVGGQWLSGLISRSTGSKWAGRLVEYLLIAFALFMVLDQLNFATNIVNTAFIFVIGGLAIAFAIAFGLGGRDFARRQLEKLDDKVDKESKKEETSTDNDLVE